ncbi:MAG TPA: hypothetical protein VEA59_01540 [Patescibacteria group bacterium]|nr:hypothetical protein [Patescibacteria group bacterium]
MKHLHAYVSGRKNLHVPFWSKRFKSIRCLRCSIFPGSPLWRKMCEKSATARARA